MLFLWRAHTRHMSRLTTLIALILLAILLHFLRGGPCFVFVAALLILWILCGWSFGSVWCLSTLPLLICGVLPLIRFLTSLEVDLQSNYSMVNHGHNGLRPLQIHILIHFI